MPTKIYIRIKTKKNNKEKITKYAYLVENKRRWKKPKQKVKKYLGKVYEYQNTQPRQNNSGDEHACPSFLFLTNHNHCFATGKAVRRAISVIYSIV